MHYLSSPMEVLYLHCRKRYEYDVDIEKAPMGLSQ